MHTLAYIYTAFVAAVDVITRPFMRALLVRVANRDGRSPVGQRAVFDRNHKAVHPAFLCIYGSMRHPVVDLPENTIIIILHCMSVVPTYTFVICPLVSALHVLCVFVSMLMIPLLCVCVCVAQGCQPQGYYHFYGNLMLQCQV